MGQYFKTKEYRFILSIVLLICIGLSIQLFVMYDLFEQGFSPLFASKTMMLFAFAGIVFVVAFFIFWFFRLCIWVLSKN